MKTLTFTWLIAAAISHMSLASPASGESGPLSIERIDCEGNTNTSCSFIKARLDLSPGDLIQDEKINEAKMKLNLLGYFDEVSTRLEKGTEIGQVILVVSVKEGSSLTVNGSLGGIFSSDDRSYSLAEVGVVDRNFSGSGDSLELRARALNTANYRFKGEYNKSDFLSPKLFLKVGLNHERGTSRAVWRRSYVENLDDIYSPATWSDIALGYKIFEYSFISLGSRYFIEDNLISGYFQYGWDSQDDPNFPTQGSRFLFSLDQLPTTRFGYLYNSNFTLNGTIAYKKHWELAPSHVLTFDLGGMTQGNDVTYPTLEQPSIGLKYSRYFARHQSGSTIQNGLVYIEPGVFDSGSYPFNLGAKIGTTFQTKYFLVNLFAIGTI